MFKNLLQSYKSKNVVWCGFLCLSVLCHYAAAVDFYKEKPEWLKTCKIYEPEFTKCSTESIGGLMHRLANEGLPELTEKFGTFDPINLQKVVFKGDNNQAVSISANLTDLVATGLSKMVTKESRVSKKDFSWQTKLFVPNLRIDGKYQMNGKILLIPLNGAGKIYLEIEKLDIVSRAKTRLYEKGGFTFYNVTRFQVDLKPSRVKSNLENIFNGNSKEVERSTNEFFNEHWSDFFDALRPLISETVEDLLMKILKPTFDLLPANFLIEDIPKSTELYKNEQKNEK